jgi:uncharacterized protein (TIGR02145 family)
MKHVLTLLAFASMSSGVAQIPEFVSAEGLVAWLPCNAESIGTQVGVQFASDRFGVADQASEFDGQSWIEINLDALPTGNQPRSFSFWFEQASFQQSGSMASTAFHYGAIQSFQRFACLIWPDTPTLVGQTNDVGYAYGPVEVYEEIETPLNAWHHVVFTFDSTTLKCYINGSLAYAAERSYETAFSMLTIGKSVDSHEGGEYFIGKLDDMGVWNRALTADEVQNLFFAESVDSGCLDPVACNFQSDAAVSDGSCEYGACHCLEGTMWSHELGGCVVANTSDTDFDGCVGMTDLLNLLSVFGTCVEVPWACGDLLEYQGYDYETVQIGEQCWFAENLRSESYENGDAIPTGLSDSEWSSTSLGAMAVYGESAANLETYGRLYNWWVVNDARGLCPSGWHVPTNGEWSVMIDFLGGQSVAGTQMKTTFGWNNDENGTNLSGFSGLPGGYRNVYGYSLYAGANGYWWSSSPNGSSAWLRFLGYNHGNVYSGSYVQRCGLSVRCVRDSE